MRTDREGFVGKKREPHGLKVRLQGNLGEFGKREKKLKGGGREDNELTQECNWSKGSRRIRDLGKN